MVTGADVAEAARKYIGSPIVEGGRSRDALDCVGLIVCTAIDLKLSYPTEVQGYGLNIWQHPTLRETKHLMNQCMLERREPEVGDVILFGWKVIAISLGIVTAVDKATGAIQKMIGGLHDQGPHFAEYNFTKGGWSISACYRFRELEEIVYPSAEMLEVQ